MTPPPFPLPVQLASPAGWGTTQIAAILVAAIAVIGSLVVWVLNQHAARRERRNQAFSESLAAVEQYLELPFRVRRRRDGIATRHELGAAISDVQVRLAQHQGWLDLVAPTVAPTYRDLVTAARREAGSAMSVAWLEPPITSDDGMNVGIRFSRENTDIARARCVDAMHESLRVRLGRRPRCTPGTSPDPNGGPGATSCANPPG